MNMNGNTNNIIDCPRGAYLSFKQGDSIASSISVAHFSNDCTCYCTYVLLLVYRHSCRVIVYRSLLGYNLGKVDESPGPTLEDPWELFALSGYNLGTHCFTVTS